LPQQGVIAKEANSEGKEREIERKRRKLIAPRSVLFGHREGTKRQRRHRGNEIGPSEKLHSRVLRNDTVASHYRNIVVWIAAFVDCETLCQLPSQSDDIARFLSPPRRGTWRNVSIVKTASEKNFSFDLGDRFSKRCNPVNRTVRLKQVVRALCPKQFSVR